MARSGTKRAPARKKATARISTGEGSKTNAVVLAAVRLLDTEGEGALGWNRLAQELGVKPPSLYNHVHDAADLMRRVAIHAWTLLAAESEAAVRKVDRPEEGLLAIARAYRSFALRRPGLFAIASRTRIAPGDPEFLPASQALFALFDPPLDALRVGRENKVHAIRLLRSAVHGFVELERAGQFAMSAPVEASFEALLRALPTLVAAAR